MYIPSKQDKANCRKGINCEYGICDECQMTIHDDQEDEGEEMKVKVVWCDCIEEVNRAIDSKGKLKHFEGLTSSNQIISISWSDKFNMFLVSYKVSDGNLNT